MDTKELVITIVIAVATCLATLIVKDLYESAKNKSPHKKVSQLEEKVCTLQEDMIILKESQKNQLWLSLSRTYNECIAREKVSELEKAAINASFKSYEALGGNHGMQTMIEEVMRLPSK